MEMLTLAILGLCIILISVIILIWLPKRLRTINESMHAYAVASGLSELFKLDPKYILLPETQIEEAEVPERPVELERVIRVLFGYGNLLRFALELGEFSAGELVASAKSRDAIVNAWIRDALALGLLEEFQNEFTGEVRYRVRRSVVDELASRVLGELWSLTRRES